jgi:hypothetical protein
MRLAFGIQGSNTSCSVKCEYGNYHEVLVMKVSAKYQNGTIVRQWILISQYVHRKNYLIHFPSIPRMAFDKTTLVVVFEKVIQIKAANMPPFSFTALSFIWFCAFCTCLKVFCRVSRRGLCIPLVPTNISIIIIAGCILTSHFIE